MKIIKKQKQDHGDGTSSTYQSHLKLTWKQIYVENLIIF